jgi:ligand-binding SRPBCC domain-containing protein
LRRSEAPVRVFLSASAIGIYGDRGAEELTESSTIGTGFLADLCARWEEAGRKAESVFAHCRSVQLRIGLVVSEQGGLLARLLPIFQNGVGGPIGSGAHFMSWVHVADVVEAMVWSLERESVRGPVNLVAPRPVTNREFTETLAATLSVSAPFPAPEWGLALAFGELKAALVASHRCVPSRLLADGFQFKFVDLVSALRDQALDCADGQNVLVAEQWIPRKIDEFWHYFEDEKNLEELTPPFLKFKVLNKSTPSIEAGTLINYSLRIHGVPARWRTRIERWEKNREFVDMQLRGPYRKWHHTHTFEPLGMGTLMRDRVIFKLPMGLLGRVVAGSFVRGDVEAIFDFRRRFVRDKFFGPIRTI